VSDPNAHLTLSGNGAAFVGAFEGFVGHLYNDAANNATIGYGHLLHLGPVTRFDLGAWPGGITRAQAEALLEKDATKAVRAVRGAVTVKLSQAQFDALCSFCYNVGPGGLSGAVGRAVNSKPVIDLTFSANAHWHRRVEDALLLWDHAGGVMLPGLERRRMAEARLFEIGKYSVRGGNIYSNWEG
jgi:lysozyme